MKYLIWSFCFLLITINLSSNPAQARMLFEHKSVAVDVDDNYSCDDNINLTIKAPDRTIIEEERKRKNDFEMIVYSAAIKLLIKCRQLKLLDINLVVGGKTIYKATASREQDWRVVEAVHSVSDKKVASSPNKRIFPTQNDIEKLRGKPVFSNDSISIYPHNVAIGDKDWFIKKRWMFTIIMNTNLPTEIPLQAIFHRSYILL